MKSIHNENQRPEFIGLPFDALTMGETLRRIQQSVKSGHRISHTVINAAKVVKAQKDERLRQSILFADLVNIDGQSVVWAARLLGKNVPERVAGIDLMENLLAIAEKEAFTVYFLGATDAVLVEMKNKVLSRYPSLKVVGSRNGYFVETENKSVAKTIKQTNPDFVFIGMPSPKKENFIHETFDDLGAKFVMGVGGSFDVMAGLVDRAPVFFQRIGLEWFFRFIQEPRRLFMRYFTTNSTFISLTIKAYLKQNSRTHVGRDPSK